MTHWNEQENFAIREKELQLREKELELRERELRIKEAEFKDSERRKVQIKDAVEQIKKTVSPRRSSSFFSLREDENAKIWSYEGRLSRKGYLFFSILYALFFTLLTCVAEFLAEVAPELIFFYLVLVFVLLVPGIFAAIKRCRDCRISPWWIFLFTWIPLTGLYLFFAKTAYSDAPLTEEEVARIKEQEAKQAKLITSIIVGLLVLFTIISMTNALSEF